MIRISAYIVLLIVAPLNSVGQYLDFLKAKHEWPAELRVPLEVKEQFLDEDAVILYESLKLDQNFRKFQFQELVVEKHKLIFIKDEDIAQQGFIHVLPESEDKLADLAHRPWDERDYRSTPELLDVEMYYYAARIYKSDGRVVEIRPVFEFQQRKVKREGRLVNQFKYRFKHLELEPGDILEIHYKYEVPYQKNRRWFNSFRIVPNGRFPRQIFDVSFQYEPDLFHTISGLDPESRDTTESGINLGWSYRNVESLSAVGNDIRAVDGQIVLGLNTYADWMYNRRSSPGFRDRIPWYMSAMQEDYSNVTWLYRIANKKISFDRQSRLVRKYLDRIVSDQPDSLPARKALAIHEDIRTNFSWQPDDFWFQGTNNEVTKMGSQVDGQYLWDRSRRSVYTRLFFECNAPVLYVRPMDKRVGSMSKGFLGKLWKTPTLFALPDKGRLHYVMPKNEYQNYYADELPFYWENTAAVIVNPFQLFSRYEMPIRFVLLPGSTENDNKRRVDVEVMIDTERNTASISMRVKLSGQYSTMCRPAFEESKIDSNVASTYGRLPLEEVEKVSLKSVKKITSSGTFPFQHTYDLEYDVREPLTDANGQKGFDLASVFPLNPSPVDLAKDECRPDFRFTDEINVLVKWEGESPLIGHPVVVERFFAHSGWTFAISPQGENAILIRSKMILGDAVYSGDELVQLREIVKLYLENVHGSVH